MRPVLSNWFLILSILSGGSAAGKHISQKNRKTKETILFCWIMKLYVFIFFYCIFVVRSYANVGIR